MKDDAATVTPEIVIVRRRSSGEESHGSHGAWKIAYADFVTAMMAFFLVMWLINASNEATRAQVASYFNPIKLTDASTGERGLKDKKDAKTTHDGATAQGSSGAKPPAESDIKQQAQLMANPDKAIAKIEAQILQSAGPAAGGANKATGDVVSSGPNQSTWGIGDPFDPRTWQKASQPAPAPPKAPTPEIAPAPDKLALQPAVKLPAPAIKTPETPPEKPAATPVNNQPPGSTTAPSAKVPAAAVEDIKAPPPPVGIAAAATAKRDAEASTISAEIAARLGTGLDNLPESVEVRSTEAGTLISLTDRQSFGMFKTGSAEPQPELVKLVEAIAQVLASRTGYIVVRGHTDSRPYRNKLYDNWQLSTARAHFAQYMLIRGGLDESRIRRIEGLADRDPRNTSDPQAPENRRIEILLGRDGP